MRRRFFILFIVLASIFAVSAFAKPRKQVKVDWHTAYAASQEQLKRQCEQEYASAAPLSEDVSLVTAIVNEWGIITRVTNADLGAWLRLVRALRQPGYRQADAFFRELHTAYRDLPVADVFGLLSRGDQAGFMLLLWRLEEVITIHFGGYQGSKTCAGQNQEYARYHERWGNPRLDQQCKEMFFQTRREIFRWEVEIGREKSHEYALQQTQLREKCLIVDRVAQAKHDEGFKKALKLVTTIVGADKMRCQK